MINKLKNVIYTGLSIVLVLFTASCVNYEQEDTTGYSTLTATNPSITITSDFDNVPPVEADVTYPFTLTLSEPQVADIKIVVYQSGGDATEGADFTIDSPVVIIPAYSMSGSGSITIHADEDAEPTETFAITIGDETTANTTYTPQTFLFTLENWIASAMNTSYDWEKDIEFGGVFYGACLNIDLDMFVSDAAGFDINDPWATFNGTGYAATGDCPEEFSMDFTDWGDGEYIIWHELWANGFAGLGTNTEVPITALFIRAGSFRQEVIQDPSQAINSDEFGVAGGGDGSHGFIAKITINGGLYTVTDYDGQDLVTGKADSGKTKTPRPAYLVK